MPPWPNRFTSSRNRSNDGIGGIADYSVIGGSVTDMMPRIISRTITTAGVNLLRDGANGPYVEWSSARYGNDNAYKELIDGSGVDISKLVEGAKIVAPLTTEIAVLDYNGGPLEWHSSLYSQSAVYTGALAVLAASSLGGLTDSSGGSLQAGEQIYYRSTLNPTVLQDSGQAYQPDVLAYKQLIDANVDFSTGLPAEGAAIVTTVQESGYGLLEQIGHIDFQNPTSGEFFIGSENPGVAPVNSWFGIFGQFFDHGLDFIGKGGNGTITIALDPSDPLYGKPGPDGQPVTSIKIARASIDGTDANGDAAYDNNTSPFIDQSQTYGSVDQVTSILREWVSTDGGSTFHAGMKLFDGASLVDSWTRRWPDGTTQEVHDTLPTLNELRAHLVATGRDDLTWEDVSNLRNRDAVTGDVITSGPGAGSSGHALLLDMNPHFDGVVSGNGHISDEAITEFNAQFGTAYSAATFSVMAVLPYVDGSFSILPSLTQAQHDAVSEILMQSVGDHYIAGDGRVNENFGLTSIHHVFHEEHNFQVENLKTWIYAHDLNNPGTTDPHEQLHNWQVNNHLATNNTDANGNYLNADGSIAWDLDKMFEATKLVVEMEYQHAAVDQYARTVTPRIQEFVGYSSGVDSTISLEYAQVAFRFGHSTIRETIDAIDPSGWMLGHVTRYALEKAFLNPQQFADTGVAAITLGLSRQQMNEVDEFVTPALNQGLLGQPLDLPAINIARGRDLGIPTLNDFRAGIGLAEYTSWADYGAGMYHPESLVNFIAAYAFGDLPVAQGEDPVAVAQAKAQFLLDLADGTASPSASDPFGGSVTATDAVAFLNNNYAGANAELSAGQLGFDQIDSWIGGLAEAHVPGGLLGETFDAVFVAQIQSLMDGDRFYYLYRLFGTQIHEEVNNGQFKDIVERNTGLTHLNGSIFAYADKYYDFNRDALPADSVLHNLANTSTYYTDTNGQLYGTRTGDGTADNPFVYSDKIGASNPLPANDTALFIGSSTTPVTGFAGHGYGTLLSAAGNTKGIYSDGGASLAPNGSDISVLAADGVRDNVTLSLIRDVRPDLQPDLVHPLEGTPTDGADSHEVIVATSNADYIHARGGDDTVYGEGGDDYIFGDGGVDRLYGGDGDDMIDTGEGPDLADGGAGKDIIYGRGSGSEVGGFDQLVGGSGNDLIVGGEGIDKLSGGSGDDIIYGDGLTNPEMGNTDPFTHAGDGNDYIDGGASGDILLGEEGDDYIVGGNDQDLMQGGQGDDIIRPGNPSQASGTTGGPDEVLGDDGQANAGFDLIDFSDYAANAPGVTVDFATQNNPLVNIDQTTTFPAWFQIEGAIGSRNNDTFIGDSAGDATADNSQGNNWLIGGSGNDRFTGAGGNDVIIGGSMRLDALIGSYAGADFGSLSLGSSTWLKDAMQTGGTGTGYADNSEDAYTGASNRATGDIGSNGLVDAANALGGAQFDKHFTDMLQSRMFKDLVLGDGGADGTADTVVFTGNLSEYSIEVINFTAPNGEIIQALKVTDNGGLVDDGTGVLVPRASDGVDLIVGVETGIFADRPQGVSLIPTQPVLDLDGDHVVVTTTNGQYLDNFNTAAFNNSNGSTSWTATPWSEINDNGNTSSPTAGQITIDSGNNNVLRFGDNGDGATILRTVNLAGVTSASVSYSYNENSYDNGETVTVQFSDDGSFLAGHIQNIQTINGNSGNGNINNVNLTGALSASSAIRFVVAGTNNNSANDAVTIDNLQINTVTSTSTNVPGAAGTDFTASYAENGARAAIASFPTITDDSATMASAKVVLTNAVAGDLLRIGNSNNASGTISVPGPDLSYSVDTSVAGRITLTITGTSSIANYQDALSQVRFFNSGDDPTAHGTNTARTIDVTVSDGLWTSNIAHTTINVTGVNDAPNANTDYIVTNQASVTVTEALLLANDTDLDGPNALDITATSNLNGLSSVSLVTTPGSVAIADNGTPGGSFSYTVNDGSGAANATDTATVNLTRVTVTTLNGATGGNSNRAEILIGGTDNDSINGGGGNDTVMGGAGDDTIVYSVTTQGNNVTSGRDIVDGGSNTATGDRFVLNGTNGAETFRIFSNTDDWDGAGSGTGSSAAHAGLTGLDASTKIVITRGGTLEASGLLTGATVLAELNNIEEITVNTLDVTNNNLPGNGVPDGGISGGDTVSVIGDFTGTGLAYSTITINDRQGGSTVDITGLTSEHRVVLNTDANGHIVGDARPQDIVNYSASSTGTGTGAAPGSPATTNGEHAAPPSGGASNGTHHSSASDGEHEGEHAASRSPATAQAASGETGPGNGEHGGFPASGSSAAVVGTADGDVLSAGERSVVSAGSGDDVVTTGDGAVVHSGDGDDIVTTGDGRNVVLAGSGDDIVTTGAGNDKIFGEAGDDILDSGAGDDMIWGGDGDDEIHAGEGNDRIESGAGADLIFTGAGSDVIFYRNIAEADGDSIADLAPGDRIDLSFIDADASADGNNAFHFGTGVTFTGAGELIVAYDAANDVTSITGNTDSNAATAEFEILVQGDHVDQLKHGGVGL